VLNVGEAVIRHASSVWGVGLNVESSSHILHDTLFHAATTLERWFGDGWWWWRWLVVVVLMALANVRERVREKEKINVKVQNLISDSR
jgi:hypothetical protein